MLKICLQYDTPFDICGTSRNIYKIEPKFYPADEVAKILNVNEMQLSRWRESRKFPEDMIDHEGTFWYSAERVKNFSRACW